MLNVKRVILLALVGILVLSQLAMNGGVYSSVTQQPVEQQTLGGASQPDKSLWVINNTGCLWDADDNWYASAGGPLEPGQQFSIQSCIIGDWTAHTSILHMSAERGAEFEVTISIPEIGFSVTEPSVFYRQDGSIHAANRAKLCVQGPDFSRDSSMLRPIPNSGYGGVGNPLTIVFTVTNTGIKTIRKGMVLMSIDNLNQCIADGSLITGDYRIWWSAQ